MPQRIDTAKDRRCLARGGRAGAKLTGFLALACLAVAVGFLPTRLAAQDRPPQATPLAGWARLITPNPLWSLHSEQDGQIAAFLAQEARIAMDRTPYAVDPTHLDELVEFPFIFSNGLTSIADARALENLKEYVERGGFFFVEGCLDHRMNRNFGVFMAAHAAFFLKLFPDLRIQPFAPNHAIFRARFVVAEKNLALIEPTPDDLRWKDMPQALYGFYHRDRLIAVVSLEHLPCEWFTKPEKIPHSLRQIANVYTYVMTR